jgi:hypothetical protein
MRDRLKTIVCAAFFAPLCGLASCADEPAQIDENAGAGSNSQSGASSGTSGSGGAFGSGGTFGGMSSGGGAGTSFGSGGATAGTGGAMTGTGGSSAGASGSGGNGANGGAGGSIAAGGDGNGGSYAAGAENGGGAGSGGAGSGGDAGTGNGDGGAGGQGVTDDNLLQGSSFETATNEGWSDRGSATILVSTENSHTGSYSLKVTDRTAGWHGAEYDALSLVTPDTTYRASAWVRLLDGSPAATLILTRQLRPNTGTCPASEFGWIATSGSLSSGMWLEIWGTFDVPAGCNPTMLIIYVESSDPTVSYYIDDVYLGVEP